MTPAAVSGFGRRQATGMVMASTPTEAPTPPCGWLVCRAPLVSPTAKPLRMTAAAMSSTLSPATVQVSGDRRPLAVIMTHLPAG